ncbi:phosphoribosyltransferase [Flindersiella endophytica]
MLSVSDLRTRLKSTFQWLGDRTDSSYQAELSGWWRDPDLLAALGPALAAPFEAAAPTVVLGLQSRGCLLGSLVAAHLGLGFVEVRKEPTRSANSERLWERTTSPDYEDRQLRLGFRRDLLDGNDRVLLVDDWIATGSQAATCQAIVADAGATWLGMSVIVDALERPELRRPLRLQSILHERDL